MTWITYESNSTAHSNNAILTHSDTLGHTVNCIKLKRIRKINKSYNIYYDIII